MRGWSITQWIVAIIVVCAAVAILWIATSAMGILVPAWAVSMGWVVIIAVVAIAAIGFLVAVWNSWFGGGGPPSP